MLRSKRLKLLLILAWVAGYCAGCSEADVLVGPDVAAADAAEIGDISVDASSGEVTDAGAATDGKGQDMALPDAGSEDQLGSDVGGPSSGDSVGDGVDGAGDVTADGGIAGCAVGGCDDSNPCTTDTCTATGCAHVANLLPCTDGSACTEGDQCQGGACLQGKNKVCADGNLCTADGCDAKSGCVFTPTTAPCEDGSTCTVSDSCLAPPRLATTPTRVRPMAVRPSPAA